MNSHAFKDKIRCKIGQINTRNIGFALSCIYLNVCMLIFNSKTIWNGRNSSILVDDSCIVLFWPCGRKQKLLCLSSSKFKFKFSVTLLKFRSHLWPKMFFFPCLLNIPEELNVSWVEHSLHSFVSINIPSPFSYICLTSIWLCFLLYYTEKNAGLENNENTGLTQTRVSTDLLAGSFLFRAQTEPVSRMENIKNKHIHLHMPHPLVLMWHL